MFESWEPLELYMPMYTPMWVSALIRRILIRSAPCLCPVHASLELWSRQTKLRINSFIGLIYHSLNLPKKCLLLSSDWGWDWGWGWESSPRRWQYNLTGHPYTRLLTHQLLTMKEQSTCWSPPESHPWPPFFISIQPSAVLCQNRLTLLLVKCAIMKGMLEERVMGNHRSYSKTSVKNTRNQSSHSNTNLTNKHWP